MIIRTIFSICFFFCFSLNAKNIDTQTFNQIDTYIKKIQDEVKIPAIAIGIIKNDNLIYKKSYSNNKNINDKSLFYIGSLTKSFTALAIVQLAQEGEINLDDSIKKYLPWFKIKDIQSIDKITIKTLLNQTSGFSTFEGLKNFDDWDSSDFALEKTIRALDEVSLKSKPPTTFEYSNINYQILGLVIEKVTGLSYNQYIKENIFDKLSMNNSFASLDEVDTKNLATGHRHWFGYPIKSDYPFSRVMLPAGYIISNIDDMSKYLIAHLNNGIYKNKQIFSPSTIKQIQTPSASIIEDKLYYGFGWFIDTKEEPYLNHLGSTPGHTSAMIIYPSEKVGVIVLTNTSSYMLGNIQLTALAGDIIDIIKNKKPQEKKTDIFSIITYILFIGFIGIQLFLLNRFIKRFKNIAKYKIAISIIFDISVILALFIILPRFYNLTFSGFLIFTPDIAYLMIVSIIIAILGFILKAIRFTKNK